MMKRSGLWHKINANIESNEFSDRDCFAQNFNANPIVPSVWRFGQESRSYDSGIAKRLILGSSTGSLA